MHRGADTLMLEVHRQLAIAEGESVSILGQYTGGHD